MTTPGSRPRSTERWWSPADWRIRTKLVTVLLVPIVIAISLGGLRIVDQISAAAEVTRVDRFVAVQNRVAKLIQDLQEERYKAIQFINTGRTADPSMLTPSRRAVDSATDVVASSSVADLYGDDPQLRDVHQEARQGLQDLSQLRAMVLEPTTPEAQILEPYTGLITRLIQLDRGLMRNVNLEDASRLSAGLNSLSSAQNEATLQLAMVTIASRGLEPPAVALQGMKASDARLEAAFRDLQAALDDAQRARYTDLISGPSSSARRKLMSQLSDPRGQVFGIAPNATSTYNGFLAELDATDSRMRNELTATTNIQRRAAMAGAIEGSALLVAALLISSLLVGAIGRTLLRSLRTLRRSALEIADVRLPDAVTRMREGIIPDVDVGPPSISAREETGDVARAFQEVHRQAVRLAAEQASLQLSVKAMMVNLARRSQKLVDLQLRHIEFLEEGEQNPEQLGFLFQLDSLAARIRRNSDNLLILTGDERTSPGGRPVPYREVIHAAISEVEQYERIRVTAEPRVQIRGHVAGDLRRMLAELLDNAAIYSPPQAQVEVDAFRTDDSLVIGVYDDGVGMSPTQIGAANTILDSASMSALTVARQVGFLIVGRLAVRHGLRVALSSAADVSRPASGSARTGSRLGIAAHITIPARLLVGRQAPAPRSAVPIGAAGPSRPTDHPPVENSAEPVTRALPAVTPAGASAGAVQTAGSATTKGDWFHSYRSVPVNWQRDTDEIDLFATGDSATGECLDRDPIAVRQRLAKLGHLFESTRERRRRSGHR